MLKRLARWVLREEIADLDDSISLQCQELLDRDNAHNAAICSLLGRLTANKGEKFTDPYDYCTYVCNQTSSIVGYWKPQK